MITGAQVVKSDDTVGRIRIAFRATDATFAVTDAAIEKDPEYIPDIAALWVPGERRNVVRAYTQALELKRLLDTAEKDRLEEAIDRLHDLRDYPFKVVELGASVDEEQVAEVFVRINSDGAAPAVAVAAPCRGAKATYLTMLITIRWRTPTASWMSDSLVTVQP